MRCIKLFLAFFASLKVTRSSLGYFLLLFLLTPLLWAAGPTLTTITVDGDRSDWSLVLANPLQTVDDGEFTPACDVLPIDRDCTPHTTISGRDLDYFAWTYDDTNIYVYLDRYGSSSNTNTFYFYCDTNSNQHMDSGEWVLQVVLYGSNKNTNAYLYPYQAVDTVNGDPMVDSNGYGDGYTLPGTLDKNGEVIVYENILGGFTDGTGFEAYLPWALLGVSSGTPIYYHVSSSNNSNPGTVPAQIDDNLGGPGGGIGAFGYYLLSLTPDYQQSVAPASPTMIDYVHTLQNTGTFDDEANFVVSSSLALNIKLYDNATMALMGEDYEGDGVWDYVNSSYDTDANGEPDSPVLPPSQTFDVLLRITAPSSITGIEETALTAYPINYSVSDDVLDQTAIGGVAFIPPSQKGTSMPGDTIYYGLQLINNSFDDVYDFSGASSLGYTITFYTDPNGDGDPSDGVLVAQDIGGDGTWDTITSGYDTNGNNLPDLGTIPNGANVNLVVGIFVPSTATPDVDIDQTQWTAIGDAYGRAAQATLTTEVRERLTLFPDYTMADGTAKYSGDSRAVFFAHTLINSWIADDDVTLATTSSQGWTVNFYTDPDGDGNPSDGQPITGPVTLTKNGGTLHFVLEVLVPNLATLPANDTITVTATSSLDPTYSVSVTDELRVSYLASYKDANRTLSSTIFARCFTVYIGGVELVPDTSNQYSIRYLDPNGTEIRNVSVYSDGNGRVMDEYTFTSSDVLGSWTVELREYGTTVVDSITIILDPALNDSTVDPLLTSKPNYGLTGDVLTITSYFNNSSEGATYENTEFRYLVMNQSGTSYLKADGAFASYTGTEYTKVTSPHTVQPLETVSETVSIPNVQFPSNGIYQVTVEWWGNCGNEISEKTIWFSVGASLDSYFDVNGAYPSDYFSPNQTIYLLGDNYVPNTSYVLVIYGPDGSLELSQNAMSSPSGSLTTNVSASSLSGYGDYTAVVYPADATIPPLLNPNDPSIVNSDTFAVGVDSDGDGIADAVDVDDDNDGILDTVEGAGDTDGDGTPDYLDLDSDGDGVWDLIEGNDANQDGQNDNTSVQDPNNDGMIDTITDADYDGLDDSYNSNPAAVQNSDGDSLPDFQDPDDDGDGIPTFQEDPNANGSPQDDDSDADGIPNYLDPDSDNDGIPDAVEGANDAADGGDGLGNYVDLDSDGDGIPDSVEGTGDRDHDGIPNYLDPDSDGDGIPDATEGASDFDGDGIPNYLDYDSDADDIPDNVEGTNDADGDGAPNFLDPDLPLDTDGDGIPDATEGMGDSDGDGIPDYQDWDSDNDGVPDSFEGSTDLDGDGIPNYLDLDSDGDGAWDLNEGNDANFDGVNDNTSVQDVNGDGMIDAITDANNNGLDDSYETDPAALQDRDADGIPDIWDTDDDGDGIPTKIEDANNDGNPANDDADGDGIPNYLDTDSDGDGIPDAQEGTYDSDGDGIPDYLDPDTAPDSDGDGIPDSVENSTALDDLDGDGTPNYLDQDSDGDGIPDSVEGAGDADGDGIPNYLDQDSDGDGILDAQEGTNDADGDGIPNYLDVDSDGDGISDGQEGTNDFDSDGIPNYLDLDSDGDGLPDAQEGLYDGDSDGNPDYLDPDSSPPPDLLRNDDVSDLSSYDPSQIFVQSYPLDPALAIKGANGFSQEGEGAKRELNGSDDDDDFYKSYLPAAWLDPDSTVLTDNSRPLVFYELNRDCTLFLSKSGSQIQITYTCP